MQSDCEIYVDPEEDEVFFGFVSEKEKTICEKLVKHTVPSLTDDGKLNAVSDEYVASDDGDTEKKLGNDQSVEIKKEAVVVTAESTDSAQPNELTLEKITDSNDISNASVELEHNYSTPMKHKIDKSILATPKSIVKADKDGGFLKILSEIALVKAEAEGDSNSESKKDEDKENKIVPTIPEIRVTEATPEKGTFASPPKAPQTTESRRFRIIYNSPGNEENVSHKPKSNVESFESERNFKNKRLDQEVEVLGSSRRKNSVDLIDFDSRIVLEKEEKKNGNGSGVVAAETKLVCDVITLTDSQDSDKEDVKKKINSRPPLRFSKEAKKVVEVLKKSTFDDALNFTIPEINLEEEESFFLSSESGSPFDETIVADQNQIQPKVSPPKVQTERSNLKSKTEENRTPSVSQRKLQPLKYFSESRVFNEIGCETKKCVKKLPLEDKRPATVEKVKGMSHKVPSSRIPVFGAKNSKIPLFERVARPAPPKTTPSKIPAAKTYKNSKFNHIESPINAYIHNRPTTLALNVKPEVKKENLSKMWKSQTGGNENKAEEKPSNEQNANSATLLPFADYKSATPYKIEKQGESRLPRLAPTVYKLIGPNSPKVLRHKGRFYVSSPRKKNLTENTIVADSHEVSVVVSQPAQKSHTIK